MKKPEDRLIINRAVSGRMAETLLLIIGVALGVGVASAGIGMVYNSWQSFNELLNAPENRQITITSKQAGSELTSAALEMVDDELIYLTSSDLEAAAESPSITYSYLAEGTNLRFGAMNFGRPEGDADPPEGFERNEENEAAAVGEEKKETGNTEIPQDTASEMPMDAAAEGEAQEAFRGEAPPERKGEGGFPGNFEVAEEPEGPQPVLDEIRALEVTPDFFNALEMTVTEGSLFTQSDLKNTVPLLVLGSDIAKLLFEDGKAMGRQVLSHNTLYTISGILESTDSDYDMMGFAEASIRDSMFGSRGPRGGMGGTNRTLSFSVANTDDLLQAAEELRIWFENEYGEGRVSISIPREEVESAKERNTKILLIILFLALAGLFIASVNVSNILLSRAVRRQKKIGILKALGASESRIFRLFLNEALFITISGTILGTLLSIPLSNIMVNSMGYEGNNYLFMIIGVAISGIITLSLNVFPAINASKTEPAIAMRNE